MNRADRAQIAQDTLNIFKQGYYCFGRSNIVCQNKFVSEFFTEEQLEQLEMPERKNAPVYEVVNESVVKTIGRVGSNSCGVLNFASAKNPGGGFLNGALAQEEALAISSDLYNAQLEIGEYYERNRKSNTALYTHNMIYSGNITFIRDSNLGLLKTPVNANVLTSPAVNAGAYYRYEKGGKAKVLITMEKRIRYILKLFAAKKDATVVLGAYGCGVFGNDANDVADIFHKVLGEERFEEFFEKIVFAVYDKEGKQYNIFKNKFLRQQKA